MSDIEQPATQYASSGEISVAYRVMGEVLVSRVVTDLVAGAGVKFAERGPRDLKGLPGRWDLFAASL